MKNKSFFSILVLALFFFTLPIQGKTIKILAIGNSFSEDAVEHYLYELAKEGGDSLVIGNACRGGQSLEGHWNAVKNNVADFEYRKIVGGVRTNTVGQSLLFCLQDENWDYISFQQVSQNAGLLSTYEPWLTNLLAYTKANTQNLQVQYLFHVTWAYPNDSNHSGFANYGNDQETMYKAIINTTSTIANNHSDINRLIPAGTAIQNGRGSFLGDIFCRDGYHLSYGLGRYTVACTWLEIVTGKSAVGNIYKPTTVSDIEAFIAQSAAHYAVITPDAVTSMKHLANIPEMLPSGLPSQTCDCLNE